jgi:hypothetical protein
VRVERGYPRWSQKGTDGLQQTVADRGRIHRGAVRHCSRQTPGLGPLAHNKRSCLRQRAQRPQVSLPLKQCTANVRARCPELLSVQNTLLPMCTSGGGRLGRSTGGRELEH